MVRLPDPDLLIFHSTCTGTLVPGSFQKKIILYMQFCIGFFSKSSKYFPASAFHQGYSTYQNLPKLALAGLHVLYLDPRWYRCELRVHRTRVPACMCCTLILVGTAVSCVYTVLEYQVHCTVLEYGMYTVPRYRTKFSTWYLVRPYLDLENCTKFSTVFLVTTKESVHKNSLSVCSNGPTSTEISRRA
jgi:hypothetical protein